VGYFLLVILMEFWILINYVSGSRIKTLQKLKELINGTPNLQPYRNASVLFFNDKEEAESTARELSLARKVTIFVLKVCDDGSFKAIPTIKTDIESI